MLPRHIKEYGLEITVLLDRNTGSWWFRVLTTKEDWSGCAISMDNAWQQAQLKAKELMKETRCQTSSSA